MEWMRLAGANGFLPQENAYSKCDIRAGTEPPDEKFGGIVEIRMRLDVGDYGGNILNRGWEGIFGRMWVVRIEDDEGDRFENGGL